MVRLRGADRPAGRVAAGARRARAGDHLLHRGHDRAAEGRDAQPWQSAGQRPAQPGRDRAPPRRPLPAHPADVPRRRDLQPVRRHLGRRDPGDPAAVRRARCGADDRARADHARGAGADDAGHAPACAGAAAGRPEQLAQPAVRRLAHIPRVAAPGARAPALRARPVLRHDRDRSHGHALHARGSSSRCGGRGALQDAPALDGRARARRAGPDSRPGRRGAGPRGDRRGVGAGSQRDARLLAAPARPPRRPSSMAGTAQAMPRTPTATAICTWSTASRT